MACRGSRQRDAGAGQLDTPGGPAQPVAVSSRGALTSVLALLSLLAIQSATADTIRKWQTPQGGLYFSDRAPPPGSVLLATLEMNDAPREDVTPPAEQGEAADRAAADGREIIRRRATERQAERLRQAEEGGADVSPPRGTTIVVVDSPPCFFRGHGFAKPKHHRAFDGNGERPVGASFAAALPSAPPIVSASRGFAVAGPRSRGGRFGGHWH